ncbi:ZNF425 [Branchiostoma lanceolatum]|uniref:ZNF425 protein n=1 Tax=Branchiostoma lanceolatum TaxID=7740 RepID=A0A8J9ZPR0_BRALA|nr:ZNF425 [Branchiostoma lanceolatum]
MAARSSDYSTNTNATSDTKVDQASNHSGHGTSERDKDDSAHLPSELDPIPLMLLECEDHGPLTVSRRPRFQQSSGNDKKAKTSSTSQEEPSGLLVRKDSSVKKRQLDVEVSSKEEADVKMSLRSKLQRTAETLQNTLMSSSRQTAPRREMPRKGKTKTKTPFPHQQTQPTTRPAQKLVAKSSPSNRIGKKMTQQTKKTRQPSKISKPQEAIKKKKRQGGGTEITIDDGKLGKPVDKKPKRQSGRQRREVTSKPTRQKTVPVQVPVRGKDAQKKTVQSGTSSGSGHTHVAKKMSKRDLEESNNEKSVGLRRSARKKETPVYLDERSPDSSGDIDDHEHKHGKPRKRGRNVSVSEQSYPGNSSDESGWGSPVKEPAKSGRSKEGVKKKRWIRKRKEEQGLYKCDHCSFVSTYELQYAAHLSRDHGVAVENWAPRKPRGNRKQHKCPQCNYTSEKSHVIYNHEVTVHKGGAVCVSCSFTGNSLEEMLKHEDEVHPRCRIARCRFKTDDPKELAEHMKIHMPNGKFQCPDCNKMFQEKRKYIRHAAKEHGRKIVNAYTYGPKTLTKNARVVGVKEKIFQCDKCDYKASRASHLKTHVLCKHTKKEELKYGCTICDYRCPYQSWVNTHMQQKHSDECATKKTTIFKCDDCEYESKTKYCLQVHRLSKHGLGEGPVKCKHCDYTTTNKNHLAKHLKSDHDIEILRCVYCRHYWGIREDMDTHIQTCNHKGDFPCEECSFIGNSKYKLLCHMKNKHGKGTSHNLCHHCGKIFYGAHKLEEHLMTHLPSKPFKCPYESCKYETIYKYNMPAHLLIHTGEKPFKCDVCSYSCAQKTNLKTHIKKHHREAEARRRGRAIGTGRRKRDKKVKVRLSNIRLGWDSEDEMEIATSHLIESDNVNQTMENPSTGRKGWTGIMERDTDGSNNADNAIEREYEGETSEDQHEEMMKTSTTAQDRELADMYPGPGALGSQDNGNEVEKEGSEEEEMSEDD